MAEVTLVLKWMSLDLTENKSTMVPDLGLWGNKPLTKPMFTQICAIIYCH